MLTVACRFEWLARLERRFTQGGESLAAVTGPYRFYDWNATGPLLIGTYDVLVAPPAQFVVHRVLGLGSILYGGNFAVRRSALDRIGGFDSSIEFHGEDTNLGRRLAAVGRVELRRDCWVWTSARRFRAMGKRQCLQPVRPQLLLGAPASIVRADTTHLDVRADMPGYEPFLLCDFHVHTRWSDGRLIAPGGRRPVRADRASSTSSRSPTTS